MEDILAIVLIFGGGICVAISFSPIGRAMAERIRGKAITGMDPAVYEELDRMREELTEVHERLDFTERLLAQKRESAELPGGGFVSLQVVQAPTPPPLPTVPPWESLPPQVVVLVLLALIAGTTIVLWPLVRAIARRIEGRGGKETAHLQDEIDQLRERVAELEATQTSMAELEERLDFAERLLTRSRESAGLPPGQPLQ